MPGPLPVINSLSVTPQSAPSGTTRHFAVTATGTEPLTITISVGGVTVHPVNTQTWSADMNV